MHLGRSNTKQREKTNLHSFFLVTLTEHILQLWKCSFTPQFDVWNKWTSSFLAIFLENRTPAWTWWAEEHQKDCKRYHNAFLTVEATLPDANVQELLSIMTAETVLYSGLFKVPLQTYQVHVHDSIHYFLLLSCIKHIYRIFLPI